MAKFVLQHRQSPGLISGIATGITISGPTGDGMVHLGFYRDVGRVTTATFESKETTTPQGNAGIEIEPASQKLETEFYREDVAIVSLPLQVATQLVEVIRNHLKLAPDAAK